jgi:hypothetical protein
MAKKITEAEAMGQVDPGIVDQSGPIKYRDVGGSLVTQVGPNQLDGPRYSARTATYANSNEEREIVNAYDRAAFERVRVLEQFMVGQADAFVAKVTQPNPRTNAPSVIGAADTLVSELHEVLKELERGTPASELAERFSALQNEARHALFPKIARYQRDIEGTHLPNMEDPYAKAQDVIAVMPFSSFRPLDPTPYLDR